MAPAIQENRVAGLGDAARSEASIPPASTPERSGRERTGSGRATGPAGADSTAASGGHNKNV